MRVVLTSAQTTVILDLIWLYFGAEDEQTCGKANGLGKRTGPSQVQPDAAGSEKSKGLVRPPSGMGRGRKGRRGIKRLRTVMVLDNSLDTQGGCDFVTSQPQSSKPDPTNNRPTFATHLITHRFKLLSNLFVRTVFQD